MEPHFWLVYCTRFVWTEINLISMIKRKGQVKMEHILTASLTDCPLITAHLHVLKMLLPRSDGGVCTWNLRLPWRRDLKKSEWWENWEIWNFACSRPVVGIRCHKLCKSWELGSLQVKLLAFVGDTSASQFQVVCRNWREKPFWLSLKVVSLQCLSSDWNLDSRDQLVSPGLARSRSSQKAAHMFYRQFEVLYINGFSAGLWWSLHSSTELVQIKRLRRLETRMQMALFDETKHSRILLGKQGPMERHRVKKTLDSRVFQLIEGRHLCRLPEKSLGGYRFASSKIPNQDLTKQGRMKRSKLQDSNSDRTKSVNRLRSGNVQHCAAFYSDSNLNIFEVVGQGKGFNLIRSGTFLFYSGGPPIPVVSFWLPTSTRHQLFPSSNWTGLLELCKN